MSNVEQLMFDFRRKQTHILQNNFLCGMDAKRFMRKSGKGIVNTLINKLPFELHIPKYQYCGPGTHLQKRLARNDPGINGLDQACKDHDIAYSQNSDIVERNRADSILAKKAWERYRSKDASFGEKVAALGVSGVMKMKSKLGMGATIRRKKSMKSRSKNKKQRRKVGKGLKNNRKKRTRRVKKKQKKVSVPKMFRKAMKNARDKIKKTKNIQTVPAAAKLAVQAAKIAIKNHKIPKSIIHNELPRIIPVPKIGGALPLIPVFAGLSALGALMGGSAGVANAVISANKAKKDFNEAKRHNQTMEAVAIGKHTKSGNGLYLKPYKTGLGLYLAPYPKNE